MDNGGEERREQAAYGPEGRGFYGAVTVSERGQVVIPAQARRDLGIEAGDKLLVLADPKEGLALVKIDQLLRRPLGPIGVLHELQEELQEGRREGKGEVGDG